MRDIMTILKKPLSKTEKGNNVSYIFDVRVVV